MLPHMRALLVAVGTAGAFSLVATTPGAAQDFPSRPIEFVVPWGPGGGADQVARKLAKLMEPKLKVSMPIINVPGATGQTGLTKMLTAPADGYSVSVFIGDTFALQAGTPLPKWTMQDIEPLGIVIQQPSAFLVAEGGRFKSWADLEKSGKTEPHARRRHWLRLRRRSDRQLPRQEGLQVLAACPSRSRASATRRSSAATPRCSTSRSATCAASSTTSR